jgi:hypothetical protein
MPIAPTDALLDEAEAIVRAEWLRLQQETAARRRQCAEDRLELPAARVGAPAAVVTAALDQRAARHTGGTGQSPVRRRSGRVWPT